METCHERGFHELSTMTMERSGNPPIMEYTPRENRDGTRRQEVTKPHWLLVPIALSHHSCATIHGRRIMPCKERCSDKPAGQTSCGGLPDALYQGRTGTVATNSAKHARTGPAAADNIQDMSDRLTHGCRRTLPEETRKGSEGWSRPRTDGRVSRTWCAKQWLSASYFFVLLSVELGRATICECSSTLGNSALQGERQAASPLRDREQYLVGRPHMLRRTSPTTWILRQSMCHWCYLSSLTCHWTDDRVQQGTITD